MNDLIEIKINYDGEKPTVSGRELWERLDRPYEKFTKWFDKYKEYGFTENIDYKAMCMKFHTAQGNESTAQDYEITIEMGKELCMLQRTDKGKQFRKYFIQIEEAWNTPEMVMSRALKMAEGKIKELAAINSRLTVDNQIMQPKADYFDELVDRNLLTNFRDTAKQLGIPQNKFIQFLLNSKYVYRDKKGKLMPYAEKNKGLFKVKEGFNEKTSWAGMQTLITPKGRETFRLLYLSNEAS